MKSASFPSIQVEQELRQAAEEHLLEGETLAAFMAIRESVERRRSRQEMIADAMASREEALLTGEYTPASEVLEQLEQMLAKAKAKAKANCAE